MTATIDCAPLMLLPDLHGEPDRIDPSVWRASGMRGTATGAVVFDGLEVSDDAVIGQPGDYYRSPRFSGSAWRVIAVQLGALDRIMALHAAGLKRDDAVSRARFAVAAGAHESARLLVSEAARRAEGGGDGTAGDVQLGAVLDVVGRLWPCHAIGSSSS